MPQAILRFYHEQALLEPTWIDGQSGYRYHDQNKIETVRVIKQLRSLDFSLDEISEMLASFDDEADILEFLLQKKDDIEIKLKHFRDVRKSLDFIIKNEQEARTAMQSSEYQVVEKDVD